MRKLIFFFILSFCICQFGVAQEAGHPVPSEHAEEAPHEEGPMATVFRWANFIVLFGGLGYLLRKPAKEFFEGRKKEISEGLNRAQHAQEEAQARMDEIERRLSRLSSEMADLRSQAEKESSSERERIVAEARLEVDRIVDQSRQEIERVVRSVERDIKSRLADRVIDRASEHLRTEMTQDDHKRVVVRFIKNL
jgi:F-type H+-transporting ATPase subunit b